MAGSIGVRPEHPGDATDIHRIHLAAFATGSEARLVDVLRASGCERISLVAEQDGQLLGHILFTPVVPDSDSDLRLMGLAPVAVHPDHQKLGIGSALVRAGIDACRTRAVDALVLVGHPHFYPRFGFVPASRFGLGSEYDVPDEVFMALELQPGALQNFRGIVRYHSAFAEL